MVVNSNAGVDPGILRHQITDLQQDVTCIPGEEEEGMEEKRKKMEEKNGKREEE